MKFLNKEISGPFTIPSGIVMTNINAISKVANEIPEIGVITTKSIGLTPREGNREPILHQYAPGCFINAVGLTNPGAGEFARQLSGIKIPNPPAGGRFLLISIFGKDADEFVEVAKILQEHADGFELNLSCPHAKGYGMAIGQDPDFVRAIVRAVKSSAKIPIIPKLTPNAPNIAEIAKAAVEGGADAICAINTVGPGYFSIDGNPVLANKLSGMSGRGVLPIGLKCVKAIREVVSVPIIGCGGISTIQDVREYQKAGADIFGIGSALAGMSSEEMKQYFRSLGEDLKRGTSHAEKFLKAVDMSFKKYRLAENRKTADDLSLLIFDRKIDICPGQFVFAWIPGIGEKPFSVLDSNPLTFAIQKRGCLSDKLANLEKGAEVYFRGPYGVPLDIDNENSKAILVGGGCGIAAIYQIAAKFKESEIFFGAKDKNHLFYIGKIKEISTLHVATEDESEGYKGFITDLLKKRLDEISDKKDFVFFNCGPEKMIKAAVEIEKKFAPDDKIYSSIDYITKCGVGICGSCASKDGRRLCVDGPFLN